MDKLAQSESSPLVVQLLLVIAQLVHLDTNQLIDCLANQPAPGALCLVLLQSALLTLRPIPCCSDVLYNWPLHLDFDLRLPSKPLADGPLQSTNVLQLQDTVLGICAAFWLRMCGAVSIPCLNCSVQQPAS